MEDWRGELEAWLAPFVAARGHSTRLRIFPAYAAGLIGPGNRKSVQPMGARDEAVRYDRLHHFIGPVSKRYRFLESMRAIKETDNDEQADSRIQA